MGPTLAFEVSKILCVEADCIVFLPGYYQLYMAH